CVNRIFTSGTIRMGSTTSPRIGSRFLNDAGTLIVNSSSSSKKLSIVTSDGGATGKPISILSGTLYCDGLLEAFLSQYGSDISALCGTVILYCKLVNESRVSFRLSTDKGVLDRPITFNRRFSSSPASTSA